MTYQVGDQQKSVTINKKKLFIIKDYNQSILKKYKINLTIPNWEKGQVAGEFPTQIIYMDNIFKAKSKEKLKKTIAKVYKNMEIPKAFDLDSLRFESISN